VALAEQAAELADRLNQLSQEYETQAGEKVRLAEAIPAHVPSLFRQRRQNNERLRRLVSRTNLIGDKRRSWYARHKRLHRHRITLGGTVGDFLLPGVSAVTPCRRVVPVVGR
jgi:hypothetical protein